jgi:hypothetical protein
MVMNTEQELGRRYGDQVRPHKAGGFRLYAWSEQNGGMWAEVSMAYGSEGLRLAQQAIRERTNGQETT